MAHDLAQLQKNFTRPGALSFSSDKSGFILATLTHRSGASAIVSLYGAHVLSWKTNPESELLFLSEIAEFKNGKAIRGGIPLVFPQFGGAGTLPSHGFLRTSSWEVAAAETMPQGDVSITLELSVLPSAFAQWPHGCTVQFTIRLGEKLCTEMKIKNTGSTPFPFQNALHTYFRVGEIGSIEIEGLKGLEFKDFLAENRVSREERPAIRFNGSVDRVYMNAPRHLKIKDRPMKRSVTIETEGLHDAVVWNPWIERSVPIKDLGPHDYRNFVCVEAANVTNALTLSAGKEYSCSQVLGVEQLG